ncbi:aldo/keto reductase [Geothrix sp. 21YS21S-4]|uniref:aldo/keto reductase n=1 Tax=Geothrix sp. 21YS21S-4 TaxID=3068889 RepID=UPI0027BA8742|nr:aldo/keto reductase [Geothrix sp. 21YS21S-4]
MELSTLGLGTYLGDDTPDADEGYIRAAGAFFAAGGNVFDTAANYRRGRSERALGRAFAKLPRGAFFVSTKAGYLPMGDGVTEESPRTWFQRVLEKPGILDPADVVDGCHALTPRYLSHQLDISRAALGVETVDLFHLHNPEQQLPHLGPDAFYAAIARAFEACETFVQEGRIRAYGVATWNGFRVPPGQPDHLSLERLVTAAEAAGGRSHHFRWIQLPLNLALPEAFAAPTQRWGGVALSALEAARAAGLSVQTSASIMQARILTQLPAELAAALGGATPAQAALQFPRSCPGVTVALCGMGRPEHAVENAAVMALPKVEPAVLAGLFA